MSLILDALNKADRERQDNIDEIPHLNTVHQSESLPRSFPVRQKMVLACIIAIFFIGLLIWIYNLPKNKEPQSIDNKVTTSVSATRTEPVIKNKPQPTLSTSHKKIATVQAEKTISSSTQAQETDRQLIAKQYQQQPILTATIENVPLSKDVNRLYIQDIEAKPIRADDSGEATSNTSDTKESLVIIPSPKPAALTSEFTAPTSELSQEKPLDVDTTNTEASISNSNSIENFVDIGIIRDLPTQVQNKIPSLFYSEHNYVENGRSYVILNGKKRYKGDAIAARLSLQDILEDGIIARFDKHSFKMKALSSWVNM